MNPRICRKCRRSPAEGSGIAPDVFNALLDRVKAAVAARPVDPPPDLCRVLRKARPNPVEAFLRVGHSIPR